MLTDTHDHTQVKLLKIELPKMFQLGNFLLPFMPQKVSGKITPVFNGNNKDLPKSEKEIPVLFRFGV